MGTFRHLLRVRSNDWSRAKNLPLLGIRKGGWRFRIPLVPSSAERGYHVKAFCRNWRLPEVVACLGVASRGRILRMFEGAGGKKEKERKKIGASSIPGKISFGRFDSWSQQTAHYPLRASRAGIWRFLGSRRSRIPNSRITADKWPLRFVRHLHEYATALLSAELLLAISVGAVSRWNIA